MPRPVVPTFSARRFFRAVEELVVRQDQVGAVAEVQVEADAAALEPRDLVHEDTGVDDAAVADHAGLARHAAGGQKVQFVHVLAHDDGVARVVAALEPHDEVAAVREDVHDLALAFVAPLGPEDGGDRHRGGRP